MSVSKLKFNSNPIQIRFVEDLEKELGPLIENFQNLVKDAKAKKLDSLREDEDFPDERITLLEVMTKVNDTFYDTSYFI